MTGWKGNVTILRLIKQACDDATAAHRPDLAARMVVNELDHDGWKIVRSEELGFLHERASHE